MITLYNLGFCFTNIGAYGQATGSYRTCKWACLINRSLFSSNEPIKKIHFFVEESTKEEEIKIERTINIRKDQEKTTKINFQKPSLSSFNEEIASRVNKIWEKNNKDTEDDENVPKKQETKGTEKLTEWKSIIKNIQCPLQNKSNFLNDNIRKFFKKKIWNKIKKCSKGGN